MTMLRAFWDAAVAVDRCRATQAGALDRTRLCDPDELRELWARTGLVEIDAGELVVGADYADFDDFWWPFPRASAAPAPTAPRSTRRDGTRCGTRSAAASARRQGRSACPRAPGTCAGDGPGARPATTWRSKEAT